MMREKEKNRIIVTLNRSIIAKQNDVNEIRREIHKQKNQIKNLLEM